MSNPYKGLLQDIKLVKEDLLKRFPNTPHTIRILLWDDNTRCVECHHSDEDKKYISRLYNNSLTYEKVDISGKVMVLNKLGEEEYYKLVKI